MGAPNGNTNALMHGLYAKHFSPEEQVGLRRMKPEDLRHEIHTMRVAVKNVFEAQVGLHALLENAAGFGQTHPHSGGLRLPLQNLEREVDGLAKLMCGACRTGRATSAPVSWSMTMTWSLRHVHPAGPDGVAPVFTAGDHSSSGSAG